jgi:hypothetical protein
MAKYEKLQSSPWQFCGRSGTRVIVGEVQVYSDAFKDEAGYSTGMHDDARPVLPSNFPSGVLKISHPSLLSGNFTCRASDRGVNWEGCDLDLTGRVTKCRAKGEWKIDFSILQGYIEKRGGYIQVVLKWEDRFLGGLGFVFYIARPCRD